MLAQPDPQSTRVESWFFDDRSAARLTAHHPNPAVLLLRHEPT